MAFSKGGRVNTSKPLLYAPFVTNAVAEHAKSVKKTKKADKNN